MANHKVELEQIDIVIPWVDGSDPLWRAEKRKWSTEKEKKEQSAEWYDHDIRYRDWDTLRYFFRGVEQFAPWVRKVHFVTWGHTPDWLNTQYDKLNIVNHKNYIPGQYLPTFNSHVIELNFHRIEGLAERFIYFNDDMFLTAPTLPKDFFRGGLPCDSAVINPIIKVRHEGKAEIWNLEIINDRFEKNQVISQHPFQWFNIRYGRYLLRNFLLMPWKQFVGFYEQHLPNAFLKSTFETLWECEGEALDATCRGRIRDDGQVSQWLMKNWQMVTGAFYPRSLKIGKYFILGEDQNYHSIYHTIREKDCKLLCINDSVYVDDFSKRRDELLAAFEAILPQKSEFEV